MLMMIISMMWVLSRHTRGITVRPRTSHNVINAVWVSAASYTQAAHGTTSVFRVC